MPGKCQEKDSGLSISENTIRKSLICKKVFLYIDKILNIHCENSITMNVESLNEIYEICTTKDIKNSKSGQNQSLWQILTHSHLSLSHQI